MLLKEKRMKMYKELNNKSDIQNEVINNIQTKNGKFKNRKENNEKKNIQIPVENL